MSSSDSNIIVPGVLRFSESRRSAVEKQQLNGYTMRKRSLVEFFTYNYLPCAITSTILAPLNRLKIIIQVQSLIPGIDKLNARDALSRILKEEGLFGLYTGNMIYNVKILAQMTTKTIFFDRIKNRMNKTKELIQTLKYKIIGVNFLLDTAAAFSASVVSLLFTYPYDLAYARLAGQLKTDATVKRFAYLEMRDCFHPRDFAPEKEFFFQKYYNGLSVAAAESLVFSTVTLLGYQMLYRFYYNDDDDYFNNFAKKLGGPALVTFIASLICYPLDTLKRAMQVNGAHGFKLQYNNLSHAFVDLRSGVMPFYRGFSLHVMRMLPFSYIQYTVFLTICKSVDASNAKKNKNKKDVTTEKK